MTTTVSAYIAKQPKPAQSALRKVRALIRAAVPGVDERISYQIPCFHLGGEMVIYFAGWRDHVALYPLTQEVRAALGGALAPYLSGAATLKLRYGEPLPVELITRLAKVRARLAKQRASSERDLKRRRAGRSRRAR